MKIIKRIIYGICFISVIGLGAYIYTEVENKDKLAPIISVPDKALVKKIDSSRNELLSGVSAKDNKRSLSSDNIFVEKISKVEKTEMNVFDIYYVAIDDNLNIGKAKRKLIFSDYHSPRFSIKEPLIATSDQEIDLTKVIDANDCIDGNLQSEVKNKGDEIDGSKLAAGDYHLELEVTNSLGDKSVLPVTFKILSESEKQAPIIKLDNYVVYIPLDGYFDAEQYPQSVIDGQVKPIDSGDITQNAAAESIPISDININSNVNTQVPGVYKVEYKYVSPLTKYIGTTTLYVCVEGGKA